MYSDGSSALTDHYYIYPGKSLPDALGHKGQTIETIFGVKGKAVWIEDEHEPCLLTEEEIRSVGRA